MVCHDFRCPKCGTIADVVFQSYVDVVDTLNCACGGVAVRCFPGPSVKGKNKGVYPVDGVYDVQTGQTFYSAQEKEAYAKRKGGMWMGPQEYERSRDNFRKPEPEFPRDKLREAQEEAWAEIQQGKITPHKVVDSRSFKFVESRKE